ncbi:MAG TPA: hypothetical protein VFW00_08855 [Rhodocyclaceae bacterium]|nr:hypothetical protein [Rhodocyclaceae bacterium]
MECYMWRSALPWTALAELATSVIERWNTVTHFVVQSDKREGVWTARHESVATPFLVLSENSLRGSIPRDGNPLAMLLLIGIAIKRADSVDLFFSNGKKIDPMKFAPSDLLALMPQATHAAHRKLAELIVTPANL